MEKQGLIQKSESPWVSSVVIIDNKGGNKHLYVNYHKLNVMTKADAYPLPSIGIFQ